MTSYLLKLFHDELTAGAAVEPGLEAQHCIIYVWKGSVSINGSVFEADSAAYVSDFAAVEAQGKGATLWRWELVPESDPIHLLKGKGTDSILRMSRRVKMFELVPTSKWLFRLDCIVENEGSTGLHSHPGSGIRCMLNGQLRVRSDKGESSDNFQPGDCWYEEGAYPLISTTDPGNKATFLRGMVLPPEYDKYPDTAVWIEGSKSCKAGWKNYYQKIVTLR
jgi:hypothetical protein